MTGRSLPRRKTAPFAPERPNDCKTEEDAQFRPGNPRPPGRRHEEIEGNSTDQHEYHQPMDRIQLRRSRLARFDARLRPAKDGVLHVRKRPNRMEDGFQIPARKHLRVDRKGLATRFHFRHDLQTEAATGVMEMPQDFDFRVGDALMFAERAVKFEMARIEDDLERAKSEHDRNVDTSERDADPRCVLRNCPKRRNAKEYRKDDVKGPLDMQSHAGLVASLPRAGKWALHRPAASKGVIADALDASEHWCKSS